MSSILESGIQQLKNDRANGARVLATDALAILAHVISSQEYVLSGEKLWEICRVAGYRLSRSRPSMSAAITSAIVDGLNAVRSGWDKERGNGWQQSNSIEVIAIMQKLAVESLKDQIKKRGESSSKLANSFLNFIGPQAKANGGQIRILTLSSSSSIFACLKLAVDALADIKFTIQVLESRPRMEGASFALEFMNELKSETDAENVKMIVAPDSHVQMLANNTDIFILGADWVTGDGDVSNKMGSFPAAICVKQYSSADVVVIAETDKIARPGEMSTHLSEKNGSEEVVLAWNKDDRELADSLIPDCIEVQNVYFEWVPKRYIDIYITEETADGGIINCARITEISQRKAKLEDELFDDHIKGLGKEN